MRMKLNRAYVSDPDLNKSLEFIQEYLDNQTFLKGSFKHYEIVIPAAVTNYRFKHSLGFVPEDVILTSVIGSSPTLNYTLFTNTFIDITVAGASTLRMFLGKYSEN